jgi:hypothetical protein
MRIAAQSRSTNPLHYFFVFAAQVQLSILDAAHFCATIDRNAAFRNLVVQQEQALIAQLQQSVACNASRPGTDRNYQPAGFERDCLRMLRHGQGTMTGC